MNTFLPIGSIVLLKKGEKRLMICGRIQVDVGSGVRYDYSGCFYPEGVLDSDELYFFNNEEIKEVFFVGFQDREEFACRELLGKIVEKYEQEKNEEKK